MSDRAVFHEVEELEAKVDQLRKAIEAIKGTTGLDGKIDALTVAVAVLTVAASQILALDTQILAAVTGPPLPPPPVLTKGLLVLGTPISQ